MGSQNSRATDDAINRALAEALEPVPEEDTDAWDDFWSPAECRGSGDYLEVSPDGLWYLYEGPPRPNDFLHDGNAMLALMWVARVGPGFITVIGTCNVKIFQSTPAGPAVVAEQAIKNWDYPRAVAGALMKALKLEATETP